MSMAVTRVSTSPCSTTRPRIDARASRTTPTSAAPPTIDGPAVTKSFPDVALRGTLSSGFHAPSLAQLGQQSTGYTSTFTNNGSEHSHAGPHAFVPLERSPGRGVRRQGAGVRKSRRRSRLGLVLRPTSTSSVTIDAYQLDVDDVITITDTIQNPAAATGVPTSATGVTNPLGQRLNGYTQATYYPNAVGQRTRGVDLVGRQQFSFAGRHARYHRGGKLPRHRSGERESHRDRRRHRAGRDRQLTHSRRRDGHSARTNTFSTAVTAWAAWSRRTLTATYYDSYTYNVGEVPGVATANGNIDQEFSPETYHRPGLRLRAELQGLRLNLLVQNVFNKYPEKYVNGNRSSGINPYSFIAPNGAAGRFIQGGVTFTF